MTPEKYYLYFIKDNGESMVLTRFWVGVDNIARFIWTPYFGVAAWNMPLFFPALEQAETVIDEHEFNYSGMPTVQIGRWISMDMCQRNQHAAAE